MLWLAIPVLIAGLYVLEKYSTKSAFRGIGYDIRPSRTLVEVDEAFTLETTIINTKWLPVDFLRLGEILPENIKLLDGEFHIASTQRGSALVDYTYLRSRDELKRTFQASIQQRGVYFFWGATLTAGSFSGLSEITKEFHLTREIVVVPKPTENLELKQQLGRFIGEHSVNIFLYEDPILTIGFRDYTEYDPMRAISWKQTARFGKLMTKKFDHTLDLTTTIILNADAVPDELEALLSMTRTVCDFLEVAETPYRLVTNASITGTARMPVVPDGLGSDHLVAALGLLGRVSQNVTYESFKETLAKIAKGAEHGRAHILLTSELSPDVSPFLHRLRAKTGRNVLMLTPEMVLASEEEVSKAV
ncbi:MAG: DUF58 domain-containing protein [Oscillospiraceae bacterium]|nr:DUF58 domain-containing protein [Oscillospiraceae bacterium]